MKERRSREKRNKNINEQISRERKRNEKEE